MSPVRKLLAASLALLSSVACSQPAAQHGVRAAAGEGDKTVQSESNGGGVSGLPFSQGQSFATLDEYLAFLKKRGAYDVPWYREVRPGVYELVSRRGPGAQPQTYAREELEKKFGFSS